MNGLGATQLVLTLAYSGAGFMAFVGVLVGTVLFWDVVKGTWRVGLGLSLAVVLLALPMQVASVVYLDMGAVLAQQGDLPSEATDLFTGVMAWALPIIVAVTALFGFVFRVAAVGVAEAAGPTSAFPQSTGSDGSRGGNGVAVLFGVVAALVSAGGFWALGIRESEFVRNQLALMPGLDLESPLILAVVVLPMLCSAAIAEEILVRGVMQRWLTRWFGGGVSASWVAIVLCSLVWSAGHAANTDSVALKFGQVFVLGLVFGWMARRHSVETSIVAHLSLNAVVGLVSVGFAVFGIDS